MKIFKRLGPCLIILLLMFCLFPISLMNFNINFSVSAADTGWLYSHSDDGYVGSDATATWSTAHSTGGFASSSTTHKDDGITADLEKGLYAVTRSFFKFDTSSLPDTCTITSVVIKVYGKQYSGNKVSIQQGTQGDGAVTTGDFNAFSGSYYATVDSWSLGAYNSFTLNAQGISDVSKTGYTYYCAREYNYDYLDSAPGGAIKSGCYYSEQAGTSNDPCINITYTTNTAPTVDYKTPVNASTGVSFSGGVKCSVYTNDSDGDSLNVTWATNESGSWVNKHTNSSEAANGTESYTFTDFDSYLTKYWWKVYVNDGTGNESEIYHFTTVGETIPSQSSQLIWNATESKEESLNVSGVSITPTSINLTISDPNGDKMNVTIKTNESGSWQTVNQSSGTGLSNGSHAFTNTSWIDTVNTTYYLWFNLTDGTNWDNETYHFDTDVGDTIIVLYDGTNLSKAEAFEDWKEGNSTYSVECVNVSTITSNSIYWINGTWGDNTPANPYYYSQTIADYDKYNETQHKIRNYIRHRVNSEGIEYIILMGGKEFPYQKMYANDGSSGPSDLLFFGCLDSTQNILDNQTHYGGVATDDSYDHSVDITVGRFIFANDTEWTNMFTKTKNYKALSNTDSQFGHYVILDDERSVASWSVDDIWTDALSGKGLNISTTLGPWYDSGKITFPEDVNESSVQLENCINITTRNDSLVPMLNCEDGSWPHGFAMYISSTHGGDDYNETTPYTSLYENFTNDSHPYFALPQSCSASNFIATSPTLPHVITAKGGAFAGFGAATTMTVGGCTVLEPFLLNLFEGNRTIGVVASETFEDIVANSRRHFNFFGDPTLKYKYPSYPALQNMYPYRMHTAPSNVTILDCDVADFDGDTMTVYYRTNASGSWATLKTWSNVDTGDDLIYFASAFDNTDTEYWWSINVTDGTYWINRTQNFTTFSDSTPTIDWVEGLEDSTTTSPEMTVHIDGVAGNAPSVIFRGLVSGTWRDLQYNYYNVNPVLTNTSWMSQYNTTYTWSVNMTCGATWVNETFYTYCTDAYSYGTTTQISPNADLNSSHYLFTHNTGSTNYGCIDDTYASPDDNTTYVEVDTATYPPGMYTEYYDYEAIDSNYQVDYVSIKFKMYTTDKGNKYGFGLKSNSETLDYLFKENNPDVYTWYTVIRNFSINPITGNAWTPSDISALNLLLTMEEKVVTPKCTQLVMNVYGDYNPNVTNPSPTNGSTITSNPTLTIDVNDTDSNSLDVYWLSNSSGSWAQFATNMSVDVSGNAVTIRQNNSNFTGGEYWWSVNATDGVLWTNNTYWLIVNEAPELTSPSISPDTGFDSQTTFYYNITWADVNGNDPTDGYLVVNISRTGWYTNQSMAWISGLNTTGALYSYSSLLTAGNYSVQFYAYDGFDRNTTNNYFLPNVSDFIWLDINNLTWALGNVVMGSSEWTNNSKTFLANLNDTTVDTDLKLQITNDGADWTAATSGNEPDVNIYRLNASINIWIDEFQIITASQTTISEIIPIGNNETFDLRFDAPSATGVGDQQQITVTATLIKH